MKKVLIVILVVLLLGAAAVGGFLWYRDAHIFVEDAVYAKNAEVLDLRGQDISLEHYNSVHTQLPNAQILWDVPFQGRKFSNDTAALTISSLSEVDLELLTYFPRLKKVDASGCKDYALLEKLREQRPECEVVYLVDLGGTAVAPEHTALGLSADAFDYDTLMENLKHLPLLTELTLTKTELTLEQIGALSEAYGDIAVTYTVDIGGRETAPDVTELDLSGLTSGEVEAAAAKLALLPGVTSVELMDGEGSSALTLADVKVLKEAAPNVTFHYTFDFYGYTLSTTDT